VGELFCDDASKQTRAQEGRRSSSIRFNICGRRRKRCGTVIAGTQWLGMHYAVPSRRRRQAVYGVRSAVLARWIRRNVVWRKDAGPFNLNPACQQSVSRETGLLRRPGQRFGYLQGIDKAREVSGRERAKMSHKQFHAAVIEVNANTVVSRDQTFAGLDRQRTIWCARGRLRRVAVFGSGWSIGKGLNEPALAVDPTHWRVTATL